MKVLFLFGGLPHYYNAILNKIHKDQGNEVVVLVPEAKGKTLGKGVYEAKGDYAFKVIHAPEKKAFLGKSFFKNFLTILRQEKPEVIVAGWPYILYFYINPFIHFYLKKNKIKVIQKLIPYMVPKYKEAAAFYRNPANLLDENMQPMGSGGWVSRFKYKLITWFRSYYFRRCDAHVCYIEEAFDILGSYGVPKERIFITYNSPDTQVMLKAAEKISQQPPVLPANPHRIIHVGRLVKWKKVHLLIEAVACLKQAYPGIELLVVGDGPELEALKAQARSSELGDCVRFVGAVYDPEVLGQYLKSSSLYVLAGVGGLSINDAMCFARPVICSVCDGTEKKLVREGYNGSLFKADDVEDLSLKIHTLLGDQGLLQQMGENSLKIIRNEVNEEVVVRGYQQAFEYVMRAK